MSSISSTHSLQSLKEEQFFLLKEIQEEFKKGMLALNYLPSNTVTFYGGAKIEKGTKTYQKTKEIAKEFAIRGWGVVSGGGPGIMSASLEGAKEGGGKSVAFRIDLENEKPLMTEPDISVLFKHFVTRKYVLRQSDVFIYAPGGLGTLDELMENLTLIKTDKYPQKPIFLFDSKFWKGYLDWLQDILIEEWATVDTDFQKLFKIVDTPKEIINELF
jgi:uncharacterized protein (TIGR00730 family)